MEFNKVIQNRYSCKKFSDKEVEEEKITEILKAGLLAPTAKNIQPQHIYVANTTEALAKIDKNTICRYNAPTVLVIAYKDDDLYSYPGGKYNSGVEDVTIVTTHMVLAAYNAGVDSCWLNRFDPDMLKKDLGLPENEHIVALMDLGYAVEGVKPLPPHNISKTLEETVSYI